MGDGLPADLRAAVALGGEMGGRFASFPWAAHPLGSPHAWSPGTRATVAMALTSRFPIVLWLGSELFLVYNDAYIPVLGEKHPAALGGAGKDVWAEIWDPIGPMLQGVVTSGVATWADDLMLPVVTGGQPHERYFTFTYSPLIEAAGSVEGVFCAVTETTEQVLGERRLEALRALGAELIDAASVSDVAQATADVFTARPADVPFVALYLAEHVGSWWDIPLVAVTQAADAPLRAVAPTLGAWGGAQGSGVIVEDVHIRFGALRDALEEGCPERALVLALGDAAEGTPSGAVVLGLNPMRPVDDSYLGFCHLLADQVTGALASVRAYEHERRRAEELEELDRAKTAFLTNVSHEFRTPLTLMLGPLEDAIASAGDASSVERLEMVRRNGLRLLRMVNSLLEFARLEAGRLVPQAVPTDVGALSAEIAAEFSDVCARAGIDLVVTCESATAEVDPDLWETVLLNLLSNAFKYTLHGSITVRVDAADASVTVTVADTGVGIASEHLSRIFERFYRPPDAHGRSAEGSGIGLALVKNLVEVHGGTVQLDSTQGSGTTVTIVLPATATPATSTVRRAPAWADAFVLEARTWIDEEPAPAPAGERLRPLVLVVDDNADMRRQLTRILEARFDVRCVSDGDRALEAIAKDRPDLVVTDVMMPTLDGFGLVAALRSDPSLTDLPVVMLSARAGLNASAVGFAAGADDYVVKPFTSADLLARVSARLDAARRSQAGYVSVRRRAAHAVALAELGRALNAARSNEELLERVLDWPPVQAADGAALGILDEGRRLLQVTFSGAIDPLIAERYHSVALDAPVPLAHAARSATAVVLPDRSQMGDHYDPDLGVASGAAASIAVPLRNEAGEVTGAMAILWHEPHQIHETDVETTEEAGALVAAAVERIRAAEAEHRVASRLQDHLLRVHVRSSAAAISALYRPALDHLRVGGDWYTATALDHARVGISSGDVAGHGVAAAAAMSQLRSALDAAALTTDDPDTVLDVVNRYAETVPDSLCTTLAYVVLDAESATFTYACAGHPFPLLVRPGEEAVFLRDGRRPPLGTRWPRPAGPPGQVTAPPGSLLVLYTDGLIERRGEHLDSGMARLADCARALARAPVGEVCSRLVAELEPAAGYQDDVAVIAIRPSGVTSDSFVEVLPAEVRALSDFRPHMRDWLAPLGLGAVMSHNVLLAVSEALNNAIEHGSRHDPAGKVVVEAFNDGGRISASVSDSGRWDTDSAASRRRAERGRGLTLMYGLARDVTITRGRMGTRVTMSWPAAP